VSGTGGRATSTTTARPAARSTRRRRGPFRTAVPWAVCTGMAAAAALRWAGTPPVPVGVGLQAITPYLLTPAWPLALEAARRRRFRLATVALGLGLLQVAALWPDVGQFGAQNAPPGSVPLRMVSANMLLDNQDIEGFAADLRSLHPDLILVQEITPWNLTALKGTGLLDDYPHQVLDPREGGHGSIILSRLPLRDGGARYFAGWPMTEAQVITAAGPVHVINVHTVAPLASERIGLWADQLTELGRLRPPAGGHLIIAGDFNATRQHAPFRRILGPELRDAYVQAGHGLGNTWPSDRAVIPSLMRIDHILVSPDVLVADVRRARTRGSDHLALVADLALPARPE
jgi:endonuclease/exonuclease/phosphatase (EEP) superfamily protein YafD